MEHLRKPFTGPELFVALDKLVAGMPDFSR